MDELVLQRDGHVAVITLNRHGARNALSRCAFGGNFIDADRALAWGSVNRVVAPDDLLPAARRLAHDIAQVQPDSVGAYKRLIDDGYALPFCAALALEKERMAADNRLVAPEEIAGRRAAVQTRDRTQ
jgi:enoyl-CoA hydratase